MSASSRGLGRASAEALAGEGIGEPHEFGDVVAFLASERASFITGASIRVDGGCCRALL